MTQQQAESSVKRQWAEIQDNSESKRQPEDRVTTAQEYLEDQAELLKEASLVYSKQIDSCSYAQGYLKQQIFSCQTCAGLDGAQVGVCYGCVVSCHTDHDIVELEVRRHFRCDCGTENHQKTACLLKKGVYEANLENRYNHNFDGLFCHCESKYDPEVEERTLIQCLFCEDWIHDTCILRERKEIPEEFDDYVCSKCAGSHPFIYKYGGRPGFSFSEVAVENIDDNNTLPDCCKLTGVQKSSSAGDVFLLSSWRTELCTCTNCNAMYEQRGLSFLLEEEEVFEPKEDPTAAMDPFDLATRALMTVDRVHAINGIRVFTGLKDEIMRYLRSFADSGKVVTANDITQFFVNKEEESNYFMSVITTSGLETVNEIGFIELTCPMDARMDQVKKQKHASLGGISNFEHIGCGV